MKRFLFAAALAALALGAQAQSNLWVFSYGDFSQTIQTNRKICLYPLLVPSIGAAGITTEDRRTAWTDLTSGLASFSNCLPGFYRGEFAGVWKVSTNWFTLTNNSGTVWASNCMANAYVLAGSKIPAYSMTQSDARYWPKSVNVLTDGAPIRAVSSLAITAYGSSGSDTNVWMGLVQHVTPGQPGTPAGIDLAYMEEQGGSGTNAFLQYNPMTGLVDIWGNFGGNGQGLYNLNGTSIAPGTLSAVAFTPAVQAMFTAWSKGFPFITVYPDGTFLQGNTLHTDTNTQTAGIQEALTTLFAGCPHGGKLTFAAGQFLVYTNIHTPAMPTNTASLTFEGCGDMACGITYAGSTTQAVITVGSQANLEHLSFYMRDMWLSSRLDGPMSLLWLNGHVEYWIMQSYWPAYFPSVCKAKIERCWFSFGDLPYFDGQQHGSHHALVGVNVDCNLNDDISIRDNQFQDLACGIAWATDHGSIENNTFEQCGDDSGKVNYPASSPYYIGAAVLIQDPSGGVWNGEGYWRFAGNNFIGAPVHWVNLSHSGLVLAENDTNEGATTPCVVFASVDYTSTAPGRPVQKAVMLNQRPWDNGSGHCAYAGYLITNTADFTYWNTVPAPTNVLTIVDMLGGTNVSNTPTNALGTTVKGQMPMTVNGVTYFIDLKR